MDDAGPRRLDSYARWGGVGFVVLFLVGVILAGDPGTKNGAKIAAHFADDRTKVLVGMWLTGVALLGLVAWAWSLRAVLVRAGEEGLGAAVLATGVLTAAVEFPVVALNTSLAFISDQPVDAGLARSLYDSAQVFSFVDWFPLVLFLVAVAIGIQRTRFAAAWLGWTAWGLAVLGLIAAAPTLGLDTVGSILVFAWIVALTVALRSRRA